MINLPKLQKHWFALAVLAILIITVIIYWPALSHQFVIFDDPLQVATNPDIRSLAWPALVKIFTSLYAQMYQPLATLSFAVQFHFWQLNPTAYHAGNLLLHLLNIVLAAWFVLKLTKNKTIALIAAALFALHPLQVETVAWISARSNLLVTTFSLACFIAYDYWLGSRRARNLVLAILFFVLALLTKPTAVTIPLVLLTIEFFQTKKFSRVGLITNAALILPTLAIGIITLDSRRLSLFFTSSQLLAYTWLDKFFISCYSLTFYLAKLLWPVNLSVLYPYPLKFDGLLPPEYYWSAMAVIILIALIYFFRKNRLVLFAAAFYLLNIILVSKIISPNGALAADRYSYLALLGPFIIIGYLISRIAYRKPLTPNPSALSPALLSLLLSCLPRLSVIAAAGFLVFLLSCFLAYQQNLVWHDSISLFSNVIKVYPDLSEGYIERGLAKFNRYDLTGALADYNRAIELNPQVIIYHINRYAANMQLRNYADAAIDMTNALAFAPDNPVFYFNRGQALQAIQKYPEAIADFTQAIKLYLHPNFLQARAKAYLAIKESSKACADLQQALKLSNDQITVDLLKQCRP